MTKNVHNEGLSANAVLEALEANQVAIDEATDRKAEGAYKSICWEFARQIKNLPCMSDVVDDPIRAADRVEPVLKHLLEADEVPDLGLPEYGTWERVFWVARPGHLNHVEAYDDFLVSWGKIELSPWKAAVNRARDRPEYLDPNYWGKPFHRANNDKGRLMLGICRELLRDRLQAPLPQQKLAEELGTHQQQVSRWLNLAQMPQSRFVEKVYDSNRSKGRAAEYRWTGQ